MEKHFYLQKICSLPLKKIQKFVLQEFKEDINFVEQFVHEVLDFSSQYGSDTSISYTAYNLTGKPSKFPDYGDFPQAFVMKTYGNWWKEAPSSTVDYMPQNTSKIPSVDFVDVSFEECVYPFRISIYETYNPGAVVRIWAKNNANTRNMWELLWEGEPSKQKHIPRVFTPFIKIVNFTTCVLRIEFNHSQLEYYTGIDAILLVGTKQPIKSNFLSSNKIFDLENDEENIDLNTEVFGKLTQQIYELNLHYIPNKGTDIHKIHTIKRNFLNKNDVVNVTQSTRDYCNNSGRFQCLPDEAILKILGYLDLISLRRCARLNRHFNLLCYDSFLYNSLSLQPYWNIINNEALLSLSKQCQHLQKLDLSWCGNYNAITPSVFEEFLIPSYGTLTHIRLNSCKFVTNETIEVLAQCTQLKELGLRNCTTVSSKGFHCLEQLSQLEYLDLYRTNITCQPLIEILKNNKNLLHLNLGSCTKINNMDEVVLAISENNKKLISLDLWKTSNLTQVGVSALSQCSLLEEVDLGWCLGFTSPFDSLCTLAEGCCKLKKLFLTAVRGICDNDLEPFIKFCPDLEQIDLLGARGITSEICLELLIGLPKLKLLDLSFCNLISYANISDWKHLFPHVSFKRSSQYEVLINFQ